MRVDGRSEEVAGRVVHAPHAIPPLARFDERFLVKKLAAMCVSAIASIVVYLLTGDRSVKSARCPWRLIGRLRVCLNHQYAEDGVYAVTPHGDDNRWAAHRQCNAYRPGAYTRRGHRQHGRCKDRRRGKHQDGERLCCERRLHRECAGVPIAVRPGRIRNRRPSDPDDPREHNRCL